VALILLWTGSFDNIVTYASVGMAFFSILTISSVYVLRWRRPDLKRPFRTPGYPLVPAIYILVSALLTGAALFNNWRVAVLSLLSVFAGVPAYYLWIGVSRRTSGVPK
jgi:basic amino acid/polyamine antiporter, APA family